MSTLCQLASTFSGTMPDGGIWAEEKRDGWRALYLPDHEGRKRLFTRNGMPLEGVDHILERLGEMEQAAGVPMVFDGEFQVGDTLQETRDWCYRGWKSGGTAGQFHAFDCLPYRQWEQGGTDTPLSERRTMLEQLFKVQGDDDGWTWKEGSRGAVPAIEPVTLLDVHWLSGPGDLLELVHAIWNRGGEGLMFKDDAAPYRRNRTDAWLKVKRGGAWMKKIGIGC